MMDLFLTKEGFENPVNHWDSLTVLTYLAINGLHNKVRIHKGLKPSYKSPRDWCSDEPYLLIDNLNDGYKSDKKIIGALSIMYYFEKQMTSSITIDFATCSAYYSLIKSKLVPSLYNDFWINSENYFKTTSKEYVNTTKFPLKLFYCSLKRKLINQRLCLYLRKEDDEIRKADETKLAASSKQCLNELEAKLGDKLYFGNDGPGSLDAVVYGHLSLILNANLTVSPLRNHLRSCQKLLDHHNRMQKILVNAGLTKEIIVKSNENKVEINEFPHRMRNMVIGGILFITTLIGYSLATGIVEIQFNEDHDVGNKHGNDKKESN